MRVTQTIPDTRTALAGGPPTAFVPTMGALHEGHLSLVQAARDTADRVAVSIFVNPTQFGPHEDLTRYPRPLERDLEQCRDAGVDLVFCPEPETVYPPNEPEVVVDVPSIAADLEGAHRPGHFQGVCRVVAKLFGIVQPTVAVFGQKDYQQLKVIEAMTAGLALPVRIIAAPTVRDADGLAMSSRNAYLSPEQRERALSLSQALDLAAGALGRGAGIDAAESAMRRHMEAARVEVDYAVVRHADTLATIVGPEEPRVCLVAGHVDQTRLIDVRVIH